MGFVVLMGIMSLLCLGLFSFTLYSARRFWVVTSLRSQWVFMCCLTFVLFIATSWVTWMVGG